MADSAGTLASLSYWVIGITFGFAAAVQPGPFQAFLIFQALTNGWRRTFPAIFAPILSDIPVVCLVLLVLTQIPPLIISVLQFAGGMFLLYLALGALAAYRRYQSPLPANATPARRTVMKATLVNLLNPNPYLAWTLVMGPLLIKAWNHARADGIGFLGSFYGTLVFTTAAILILFASARSLGPRITRILLGVSAAALFLFGLYQGWSGATALIRRL